MFRGSDLLSGTSFGVGRSVCPIWFERVFASLKRGSRCHPCDITCNKLSMLDFLGYELAK